ncbi:hypothetical protein [Ruminococcus sp.]|uniref:hypothetical protein n=1 Tax=Ruminococcus sp. TaxID=41978 RepID=UPI0025DB8424|nr:hypothetical protein [Ruminococcus sp.]MBQ8965698.1 hypothetical protein [Ruminococcus sp.]
MSEKKVFSWVLALTGTFCGFADIVISCLYIGNSLYHGATVRWWFAALFMLLPIGCTVLGIVQIKRLRRGEKLLLPVVYLLLTAFALYLAVAMGREAFLYIHQRGFFGLSNAG